MSVTSPNVRIAAAAALAVVLLLVAVGLSACASEPTVKAREPLALTPGAPQTAQQATSRGTAAYLAGQYDEAKSSFAQAVSAAPNSGEAHYNLGLALFKLGDTDAAREHFMQAANLSPGNKVIWDSPALSIYGSPESANKKKGPAREHSMTKPQFGGVGPR
jgi:Tfp pilus assembly protein PilF